MNIKNAKPDSPRKRLSIQRWMLVSAIWLSLVTVSLLWNMQIFNGSIRHLALSEARSLFNKDLIYRRWAALQGGVYVPPTADTPSNPYLDVPERDVVTTAGKKLTLVNPSYMVRQIHEMSAAQGEATVGHITSLNPIRPQNAPDAWEAAALRRFETGLREYDSVEILNEKPYLRFMGAMLVEKPCLKCHAQQGYKEGDVRGGISVSVPLDRFELIEQDHFQSLYLWHLLIGLLGWVGISFGLRRLARIETEQRATQFKLNLYADRHALLQNVGEGVYAMNESGECTVINPAALEMLGYREEEVIGKNAHLLFHHHYPDGRDFPASECPIHRAAMEEERHADETYFFRKNGEMFPAYYIATPVAAMEATQELAVVVGFQDISDRKKVQDEIKHMAFYDPLTGLANRRLMTDRMEQTLAHARRSGELVAVCMIDMDGFKQVNDNIGHQGGDQLLIEVARRLQECIRQTDTASRLGGDEFVLILSGFKKISECEQSLKRIIASLAMPYSVANEIANVSASIGATIFPNDGGSPDLLLRHADQSMYEAKQAGKNCYRLFNPTHHNQQQANQATLRKIEQALTEGQLVLFYQPQIDCKLGKVIGVEALIRWNHPILGLLAPSEFIPLLEHDDLVITVGEWVIREALQQLTQWHSLGLELKVGVNISARQLHQSNFVERLHHLLADFEPRIVSHLVIEILETAALEDVNAVADAIKKCRDYGIHFALDDFGTGFSSLSHLKQLPVDMLKIDQSFVFGMLHNAEDLAIVRGVVALAASFKRDVTAEGVESIDHILLLMEMGCTLMQGYCIARPMPPDQVAPWIKAFKPDPLWQLPNSNRPSRSYFELLLAEASHRHWIDRLVQHTGSTEDNADAEFLIDHRHCQLGRWYYGKGGQQFGTEDWFRSIEPLHQQIHQTAARLCEYKRNGNTTEAQNAEAQLQARHNELEQILRCARKSIADEYLKADPNFPSGDKNERT